MPKIRVLVFPAGEINSLELHEALAYCVNIEVFGASSIDRHGPYLFANYISGLPMIDVPEFLPRFRELLEEKKIDVIFPTHDTVALFLAAHAAEIPAKIMGADYETCAICRDKLKTYQVFKDEDFCPDLYKDGMKPPFFAKPRQGEGSKGIRIVEKMEELETIDQEKMVVCEYLPGEEFTVDCLTDRYGNLRVVAPRSRIRIMAGISMAAKTESDDPQIRRIAEVINQRLSFIGLWWFQIKKDARGKWKLLEISARAAGSMILTRARGINLPLLSVYTVMGRDIDITPNPGQIIMDSALARRFRLPVHYERVYLDFDDTLIINEKVNLKAIWFVYQCRNKGKKLFLLTRHAYDLAQSLEKYAISPLLFDSIFHIEAGDRKSDYIEGPNSILIDNSWKERHEAQEKLNIPVYDVDGIDFLMEWAI